MKKTLPLAIILMVTLSSCTFPWQKTTPAETETIIEETGSMPTPGSTANTIDNQVITPPPEAPKDITPSDTPKAIAE